MHAKPNAQAIWRVYKYITPLRREHTQPIRERTGIPMHECVCGVHRMTHHTNNPVEPHEAAICLNARAWEGKKAFLSTSESSTWEHVSSSSAWKREPFYLHHIIHLRVCEARAYMQVEWVSQLCSQFHCTRVSLTHICVHATPTHTRTYVLPYIWALCKTQMRSSFLIRVVHTHIMHIKVVTLEMTLYTLSTLCMLRVCACVHRMTLIHTNNHVEPHVVRFFSMRLHEKGKDFLSIHVKSSTWEHASSSSCFKRALYLHHIIHLHVSKPALICKWSGCSNYIPSSTAREYRLHTYACMHPNPYAHVRVALHMSFM